MQEWESASPQKLLFILGGGNPSQGIPLRLLAGKSEPSFKDKSFEHTSQTGCHFRDSGVENEFYLNMKQIKRVKKA